jgi:hypothetical protein
LNQNTTGTASNVTGTVALANGGSGQTTAQLAMNAFAGAVTSGSYLRGNGTNVVMNTIQAADVPTLNQNTTGSAATVTTTINSGVVATTQTAGDNSTKVATTAYVNAITGTAGLAEFKNRIINGAMVIDQRNAGASVSVQTTTTYTLDRWYSLTAANSKYTIQQNAGSVTPPAGFTNYLGVTVGASAGVTVGATDQYLIRQLIEGFNVADFAYGTASASTVTLSFWVRSSLTGTFGGALVNNAGDRSYPFTYSISSANTWEQKSVTVAGITTGTWVTNNGNGLNVTFSLGVGSTYSGTAGAWASAYYANATGSVKLVETNSATFYITGVQLEKGSTATSFDYRPYGTELVLCQRYYTKLSSLSGNFVGFGSGVCTGSTSAAIFVKYPVRMRAAPTLNQSNTALYDGSGVNAVTSIGGSYYGDETLFTNINVAVGLTLGRGCILCGSNSATAYIDLLAEL